MTPWQCRLLVNGDPAQRTAPQIPNLPVAFLESGRWHLPVLQQNSSFSPWCSADFESGRARHEEPVCHPDVGVGRHHLRDLFRCLVDERRILSHFCPRPCGSGHPWGQARLGPISFAHRPHLPLREGPKSFVPSGQTMTSHESQKLKGGDRVLEGRRDKSKDTVKGTSWRHNNRRRYRCLICNDIAQVDRVAF